MVRFQLVAADRGAPELVVAKAVRAQWAGSQRCMVQCQWVAAPAPVVPTQGVVRLSIVQRAAVQPYTAQCQSVA